MNVDRPWLTWAFISTILCGWLAAMLPSVGPILATPLSGLSIAIAEGPAPGPTDPTPKPTDPKPGPGPTDPTRPGPPTPTPIPPKPMPKPGDPQLDSARLLGTEIVAVLFRRN